MFQSSAPPAPELLLISAPACALLSLPWCNTAVLVLALLPLPWGTVPAARRKLLPQCHPSSQPIDVGRLLVLGVIGTPLSWPE